MYYEWMRWKLTYRFSMISQVIFKCYTWSGKNMMQTLLQMHTCFLSSPLMFIFLLFECLFQKCLNKKGFWTKQNGIRYVRISLRGHFPARNDQLQLKKRNLQNGKLNTNILCGENGRVRWTEREGERCYELCVIAASYVLVDGLMSMFSIMWHLRYESYSKKKLQWWQ